MLQLLIIAAAVAVAVLPLPRALVERVYSRGIYPAIQPRLTSLSNHVAFALFDVALVALIAAVLAMWVVVLRRRARGTFLNTAGRLVLNTGVLAALVYVWFLAGWGLNYQREPLRTRLDFQEDRITSD